MKKIEQKRIVRVSIPITKALDTKQVYGQAAYMLMVKNVPNYGGVTDNNIEVQIAELNFMHDNFIQLLLNETEEGFSVDWLKSASLPFIELPLDTDTGDLYIYQNGVLENETHKLIRIYNKGEKPENPLLPSFEILKAWNKKFKGKVKSDPNTYNELLKNYIEVE